MINIDAKVKNYRKNNVERLWEVMFGRLTNSAMNNRLRKTVFL